MKLRHDMLTHGVNVVCAQYKGNKGGLAVAWATQVDTDYILICVGSQSYTRNLILDSKAFGLSVLEAEQISLARIFGSQSSRKVDKFKEISFHTAKTGSPLLDNCAVTFDCEVKNVHDHDDTKLIIGKIVAAEFLKRDYKPLVYRQDDY